MHARKTEGRTAVSDSSLLCGSGRPLMAAGACCRCCKFLPGQPAVPAARWLKCGWSIILALLARLKFRLALALTLPPLCVRLPSGFFCPFHRQPSGAQPRVLPALVPPCPPAARRLARSLAPCLALPSWSRFFFSSQSVLPRCLCSESIPSKKPFAPVILPCLFSPTTPPHW